MLAGNFLIKAVKGFDNIELKLVISTCINSADLINISSETRDFIEKSKIFTGNTLSDVCLNNIPFDFKATPSPDKNFIVFANYENFAIYNDVARYHNSLYSHLHKIPMLTPYQQDLRKLILDLSLEKTLDVKAKQEIINSFIVTNVNRMSLHDRVSLVVPITDKLFVPDPLLKEKIMQIALPLKRSSVDSAATKKAIMDTVQTWDMDKRSLFNYSTHGIFNIMDQI